MYQIVRFLSLIIREFYLINPLKDWLDHFNTGYDMTFLSELILLVIGPFLHWVNYHMTDLFYTDRRYPMLGSLLYLCFTITHLYLIYLLVQVDCSWVNRLMILGCYLLIIYLSKLFISILSRKVRWS